MLRTVIPRGIPKCGTLELDAAAAHILQPSVNDGQCLGDDVSAEGFFIPPNACQGGKVLFYGLLRRNLQTVVGKRISSPYAKR